MAILFTLVKNYYQRNEDLFSSYDSQKIVACDEC